MKFFFIWLTFLVCVVFLKYADCLKCNFKNKKSNYICFIKSDTSSIEELHTSGKTDDDVKYISFDENKNEDLIELDLKALCQRFRNAKKIFVKNLKSVNENLYQQCKNLKEIAIENSEMEKIPENIFSHQSNLTNIYLRNDKLRILSENIFMNQKKLDELHLDQNQISCLPPNIFNSLTKLSWLKLSGNKIQSLNPKWFENLHLLHILDLSYNKIQDLPKNIFTRLNELIEIYLEYNQLTTIHSDSFTINRYLLTIEFQNNKINAIDEQFMTDNAALNWLNMTRNLCSNEYIYEKNKIKQKLSNCFKNYQSRVVPSEMVSIFSQKNLLVF